MPDHAGLRDNASHDARNAGHASISGSSVQPGSADQVVGTRIGFAVGSGCCGVGGGCVGGVGPGVGVRGTDVVVQAASTTSRVAVTSDTSGARRPRDRAPGESLECEVVPAPS